MGRSGIQKLGMAEVSIMGLWIAGREATEQDLPRVSKSLELVLTRGISGDPRIVRQMG